MRSRSWLAALCAALTTACGAGKTEGTSTPAPGAPSLAYASSVVAPGTACAHGGVRVDMGIDDDRNGRLDPAEVDASEYVCNGAPGANALVRTTPEPPGARCAGGGVLVESGLDADGDGLLDPAEVGTTRWVCNGAGGTPGGAGGTSLVRLTPEGAGLDCPTGGVLVEAGLDANRDLVLDPAEVTTFQHVCNGFAPGALPPPLAAAAFTGSDATVVGTLATGDYLVGDGTRADFFALDVATGGVIDVLAAPAQVELHLFEASCHVLPDVADWGPCWVGAVATAPYVPPGSYVLMVKGAAATPAWQSVPYRVELRLWANVAGLAAGVVDGAFGGSGLACAPATGAPQDHAAYVAVQGDGRIVLAIGGGPSPSGPIGVPPPPPIAGLARFTASGALDASYDVDGIATWTGYPAALALQPDDRAVIASSGDYGPELRRFLTTGAPDPSFGVDGLSTLEVGSSSAWLGAVAAAPGGKLVASGSWGGWADPQRFLALRTDAAGALDPTFAGSGYDAVEVHGAVSGALALQDDGKLVVASSACPYPSGGITVLARYGTDGALDPTFDGDGIATTDGCAPRVAALGSGDLAVAGWDFGWNVWLTRFAPDGAIRSRAVLPIDAPFTNAGSMGQPRVVFSPADRVLVLMAYCTYTGPMASCGAPYHTVISRYALDGRRDAAFGAGGMLILDGVLASEAAVAPDGRILLSVDRVLGPSWTAPCVMRIE